MTHFHCLLGASMNERARYMFVIRRVRGCLSPSAYTTADYIIEQLDENLLNSKPALSDFLHECGGFYRLKGFPWR